MPGPPPKPAAIRELEGDRSKRPRNTAEPQPKIGLPKAPPYLSRRAKTIWKDIGSEWATLGVLAEVDWAVFAQFCSAQAAIEALERDLAKEGYTVEGSTGSPVLNPKARQKRSEQEILIKAADRLGLSPAMRSKVKGTAAPKRGILGELLGGKAEVKRAPDNVRSLASARKKRTKGKAKGGAKRPAKR